MPVNLSPTQVTAIKSRLTAYTQLMRIDRPIGTLLVLWPTLWSLWIAAAGIPSIKNLIIFSLGTFLMRSAGCVINDFADRKIDGHVSRTNNRPLVIGAVKPVEAIALFIGLCLCCVCFASAYMMSLEVGVGSVFI